MALSDVTFGASHSLGRCPTSSSRTSPTPIPAATCCSRRSRSAITPGQHVGLVGANGVGKSTLFRVLAGRAARPTTATSTSARSPTWPRTSASAPDSGRTVRELLLETAPARLRTAGERMLEAERELAAGADPAGAGMRLGEAIGEWSELGGYELEGRWDAACRRIVRAGLDEVGAAPDVGAVGRRAQAARARGAVRGRGGGAAARRARQLPRRPGEARARAADRGVEEDVLLISHDRDLLSAATNAILTLEANGTWTHGGSYRTYPEAREQRQQLLGDRLEQWKREERRLFHFYKIMKQRAAIIGRERQARRRGRDALEAVRRRRPAARAGEGPADRRSGSRAATRRGSSCGCATSRSTGSCGRSRTRSTSASGSG